MRFGRCRGVRGMNSRHKIACRVAARYLRAAGPIPEFVRVGEELDSIAGEYEKFISQFESILSQIDPLINKIADLKQSSKEHSINIHLTDLLKSLTQNPQFIRLGDLKRDMKMLRNIARDLKSARR
jgi:hypothetical protein